MRSSGVLLHPTSLPGPFGIGELGPEADRFIAGLNEAGQRWWQVLPIGPTGFGDSPYQSPSTFAGNPLLISFDLLADEGLLTPAQLDGYPEFIPGPVRFGDLIPARMQVLAAVAGAFEDRASPGTKEELATFAEADWLADWSLFTALKTSLHGRPWTDWPAPVRDRQPAALAEVRRELAAEVRNATILQFLFFRQWERLRKQADRFGIGLIGDLPIFVAHDSADVWAQRNLFELDRSGRPTVVAGVPPDYFSKTGQRWGNPLYTWPEHAADGFSWWKRRLRHSFALFDLVRVDHFRGFAGCWEIPTSAPTAETGRWVAAPGGRLLFELAAELGRLPIIAEDLGVITPDVEALRDDLGLPGMRVLQFGFADDPAHSAHHPSRYVENSVCYTGTHDNDTTVGWFWGANARHDRRRLEKERRRVLQTVGTKGEEIHWDLIRLAMRSVCDTVIIPVQDLLGLGREARMNTPAVEAGNWTFRLVDQVPPPIWERLGRLTAESRRHA